MSPSEHIFANETLRYPKPARPSEPLLDGLKNFHYVTRGPSDVFAQVQLESGINPVAATGIPGQRRRPAVLIRSSPWKAGTATTPWHDSFDIIGQRAVYFGDHKADTVGPIGSTPGNKVLEETWAVHRSHSRSDRLAAPPLVVFRSEPWKDPCGKIRQKGAVEFIGVAIIRQLAAVKTPDPDSGLDFPNYRADLHFVPLDGHPPALDWTWINARRSFERLEDTLELAPTAWRDWVEGR